MPLELDEHWLEELDEYLSEFRGLFARADQARSFYLYVRGLLAGNHRKNVESIAGRVQDASRLTADLAQSLQHFVSQSPWDPERVLRRYRSGLSRAGDRVWVVHDGVIPKKGRHSVGVQRQFARALGRKVNCQVAVVIGEVGGDTCHPLAARLYLPASWLRDEAGRGGRAVPEANRRVVPRPEIALNLLDTLLDEGKTAGVIAEDGYASSPAFLDGLMARGVTLIAGDGRRDPALTLARGRFEDLKEQLGLGHFEGRTWTGWHHHVALVFTAYGFLVSRGLSLAQRPVRGS
jgi:SRSO17 transposase